MRKKRRSRGYRNLQRKAAKPNFIPVILILCLSIGCGYATAKYVVDPVVNYVPQLAAESGQESEPEKQTDKTDNTEEKSDVVEDEAEVEENGKIAGYALQFGCYSSKTAAEKAMSDLETTGLQIMEQNSMYKIVGEVFDTKDEAKEALESFSGKDTAFVTTIYE